MNYLHYQDALSQFYCGYEITALNELIWHGQNPPTQEQVSAAIAAEPLRQLRIQRNQLLSQSDWRMTTDYPYADQSAWATYRTALRDLPATANPTLDENGQLTNVDWPTPPSDL
jgi:hypothetical protein